MAEQPSEKGESTGGGNFGLWLAIVVAVIVAAIAVFVFRGRGGADAPGGNGPAGESATALKESLSDLRVALAATENLEPMVADEKWEKLRSVFPKDASIALNRALNRVLRVDALTEAATSAVSTKEEKQQARSQFIGAADSAQSAIQDYDALESDPIMRDWLESRIELHKATLLPASTGKSIRMEIYDRLTKSLTGPEGKKPESIKLAGSFLGVLDELEDPIDGLPTKLLGRAAPTVRTLSDQHPNNLYVAIRAARLSIDAKSKDASTYVRRTYSLAKAIDPLLAELTKPIGLTPSEMVDEIAGAIDAEDWDTASNRMLQMFNVLNPSEILRADRRRAAPHPLDRLSFETLRRLSADQIKLSPLGKGEREIVFAETSVGDGTDLVDAVAVDFDLDLDPDLATLSSDGKLTVFQNQDSMWTESASIELPMKPTGMMVADLFMVDSSNPNRIKSDAQTGDTESRDYSSESRHNTFPGLIVHDDQGVRLVGIDGRESTKPQERLALVDNKTGLEEVAGITAMVTGDFEGDGDLDLAFATSGDGVRIFINRGNRTFFETEIADNFDSSDPVGDMAIVDLDRDLDLDIVTVHPRSGHVGILENLLHLQFRARMIDDIPPVPAGNSIAVSDVDGNVSWDLIVGGSETAVVYSQTADAGIWTVEKVEAKQAPALGMKVADLDNDSWDEIVDGAWIAKLGPSGMDFAKPNEASSDITTLDVADFDGDGLLDQVRLTNGRLVLGINETKSDSHHVDVRFKGIADNNASSGRVNHYGIGSVLELRFGPHYRSRVVTSPSTHFGMGEVDTASSVRVIMPNGITQTIRDPKIDAVVEEQQTLKGSCPYLYAWDGEKYAFVTDCLWAAPLGLQVARGVVAKDRPWEYLKIDGSSVRPKDDRYSFRITEELWEIAYFDKVAITAVDHPANVDVWTNEKVGPGHIAEQRVFAFAEDDLRTVQSAKNSRGEDVTQTIKHVDENYVQGFDRRLRQGLCPPHWVDLDFGTIQRPDDASVFLVLRGWILPTDTSLNIQIDQNPGLPAIEFPSVWVPDDSEADGWRKAIPFMGFPGGKTKTIVVDVTDVLVKDDPRLRVRTSAQIYWDCAQLAIQDEEPNVRQHRLQLLDARIDFHGFSQRMQQSSKHPELYRYHESTHQPKWPPLRGGLTRFGECRDLVAEWDDRMAVISGGDEIRLTFSVPAEPIPDGWKRDFVIHCVGWDKDADLNTLTGQSVGPLPFREMATYPPTLAVSDKASQVDVHNQSHLTRKQSFRAFWYRPKIQQETPSRPFTPRPFDAGGLE